MSKAIKVGLALAAALLLSTPNAQATYNPLGSGTTKLSFVAHGSASTARCARASAGEHPPGPRNTAAPTPPAEDRTESAFEAQDPASPRRAPVPDWHHGIEAIIMVDGTGTKADPWKLTTPPGTSTYEMYRDESSDPPALVCVVGSTTLKYHLAAIDDLAAWLRTQPGWVPLGAADEKKAATDGTVEAWGRSEENPVGGWYGLRAGYRGRFGMYLPPLLEALGLAQLTHDARNNSMRAR